MTILRYCLLAASMLLTLLIVVFSIGSGALISLGPILGLTFLGANIFYIFVSEPKIRSSDILHRAADYSAFMTLEIKHQAIEAKEREARAEEQRLADIKANVQRLSVAKEFLEFVKTNPLTKKHYDFGVAQIAARSDTVSGKDPRSGERAALPSPVATNQSSHTGGISPSPLRH